MNHEKLPRSPYRITAMLAEKEAERFAKDWCDAWNSHDLEAILSHYSDDVALTSPTAARLLKDPRGLVVGKEALQHYFSVGLMAYPNLRFEVLDVTCGVSSVVVYYANQNGTNVSEYMELNSDGKIAKVIAHYSA